MKLNSEYILGVKVNTGLTQESVVEIIDQELLKDGKCHYICTTNPEFIMDAQSDPEFKEIINDADLSVPDGVGVMMALDYLDNTSKYTKGTILYPFQLFVSGLKSGLSSFFTADKARSRIDGVGLVRRLIKLSANKKYSIFLLGGRTRGALGSHRKKYIDIASVAAAKIRQEYPNVIIIGSSSEFSRSEGDDDKTVEYIHKCMAKYGVTSIDFLFVAYNHIYQEKWILRNAKKVNARIAMGVGASIDYIAGHQVESPDIVSRYGLGWLFRVIYQPWRIKRVFRAFPAFPLKVFFSKLFSL